MPTPTARIRRCPRSGNSKRHCSFSGITMVPPKPPAQHTDHAHRLQPRARACAATAPHQRLTRGAPKRREKSRSRSPRIRPPRRCRERPRAQPARLHRARHCRTSSCLRRPSRASRAGSTRGDLQRQTRLDADDGGMTMPKVARVPRGSECTPEVIVNGLDTNSSSCESY